MKSLVNRMLSVGIALAAVVAVHAQDKTVTANVPFSFYMGSTLMPQGAYCVDEFSRGAVVRVGSLRENVSKAVTATSVFGKKVSEPARLVFHRYGANYFLAEIWTDGNVGRAIARSTREKELARNGAAPSLAVIRLALP